MTSHLDQMTRSMQEEMQMKKAQDSMKNEQQKQVNVESEKISKDEVECKAIAEDAQADLDKALPALEAAQKALEEEQQRMAAAAAAAVEEAPVKEQSVVEVSVLTRPSDNPWVMVQRLFCSFCIPIKSK